MMEDLEPCPHDCPIHAEKCWGCGESFVVPAVHSPHMWHMVEALYCMSCLKAGKWRKRD